MEMFGSCKLYALMENKKILQSNIKGINLLDF
jgi:hypothetical protein